MYQIIICYLFNHVTRSYFIRKDTFSVFMSLEKYESLKQRTYILGYATYLVS